MCRLLAASPKLAERHCDIRLVRGGERRGLLANLFQLLDLLQLAFDPGDRFPIRLDHVLLTRRNGREGGDAAFSL
jgi:hypothetical protein